MVRTIVLLASLAAASGSAQAQDWGNVKGWDVIGAEDQSYCAIHQGYEGKGETNLGLIERLDGTIVLSIDNDNWSAEKSLIYDLSLIFDTKAYDVKGIGVGEKFERRGFLISLNVESSKKILSNIAASSGLKIYLGDTLVDNLSLSGTSAAIQRMDQCLAKYRAALKAAEREKQRWSHIPDDPFSAEKTSPEGAISQRTPTAEANDLSRSARIVGGYIQPSDYPDKALRQGIGGTVRLQLSLNEFAQPTKCKILVSSGNKDLDDETCIVAAKRLRFEAALDDKGRPIAGQVERAITWKAPPPEPPPPPPPPKLEIER
jgi:TonB family protein